MSGRSTSSGPFAGEARKGVRALALALVAIGITIGALGAFIDAITRRRDIARQLALGRTRHRGVDDDRRSR
jgi:hypothetical protein